MIVEVVVGAVLVLLLGALWYHRRRAARFEASARAAAAAVESMRSVNTELRASLDRALAAIAARNAEEAQADAYVVQAVSAQPDRSRAADRVADLLNGLHPPRPGPGAP